MSNENKISNVQITTKGIAIKAPGESRLELKFLNDAHPTHPHKLRINVKEE